MAVVLAVVAVAAACQKPAATAAPVPPKAVASVKQIMVAIVVPSSTVVFNSVESVLDVKQGVRETVPQSDEDWAKVANNAVMLTEAGNLLMVADRVREKAGPILPKDRADWTARARDLVDAGAVALSAAKARNPDALLEAGDRIDMACDECHERYQEGNPGPESKTPDQKYKIIIRYPDNSAGR
jgi:hypothetical protein